MLRRIDILISTHLNVHLTSGGPFHVHYKWSKLQENAPASVELRWRNLWSHLWRADTKSKLQATEALYHLVTYEPALLLDMLKFNHLQQQFAVTTENLLPANANAANNNSRLSQQVI
uniref:Uncharacterized protein n=1 Tax=Parascaris univalens TaxID=6257 RepID=A0A915BY69_PARUN